MKAKIPVLTLLLAAFVFLWLLPQAGAQVNIPYTNNFDNPWDVAGGADPDFAIS